MSRKLQLKITLLQKSEIALSLKEAQPAERRAKGSNLITMAGLPLKMMLETILTILKKQGYPPTQFAPQRKKLFDLDEPAGILLGLIFFALKPLKKPSRMKEIVSEINRMSGEEPHY